MALNYSVHDPSAMGNSATQSLPAPFLHRRVAGGQRLAHGGTSAVITGPCELYLVADEDCWIDVAKEGEALNPAASSMKIPAGVPMWFSLRNGTWQIETVAA